MRQFDVYRDPSVQARTYAPYLVVLSSHLIIGFDDTVVAPLVNDSRKTVGFLEIDVDLEGEKLVLVLSELAGVEGRRLRDRTGTLLALEDDIRRALDRLFTGF